MGSIGLAIVRSAVRELSTASELLRADLLEPIAKLVLMNLKQQVDWLDLDSRLLELEQVLLVLQEQFARLRQAG